MRNLRFFATLRMTTPPAFCEAKATVSAPASVGASKLRLEVATGNPHPYTGEAWGVHTFCPPCVKEGGTL